MREVNIKGGKESKQYCDIFGNDASACRLSENNRIC
jgi:hypothetical protein